jgi:hypothetical protein
MWYTLKDFHPIELGILINVEFKAKVREVLDL